MKSIVILALVCIAVGCVAYRMNPGIVGEFASSNGTVLTIAPDGAIWIRQRDETWFIGMVTIVEKQPVRIRVVGPDTSPFVGTTMAFDVGLRHVSVKWHHLGADDPLPEELMEFDRRSSNVPDDPMARLLDGLSPRSRGPAPGAAHP